MRQRWMVVAAAAVTLAVGCGASETSGSDVTQPTLPAATTPSADGCASAQDAGLESIVALVPDTTANRAYTRVGDLEAFLDDQGKALLGDFREIRWVDPVARFTPTPLVQNAISRADETTDPLDDELGLELSEVRQGVTAGLPPESTDLLVGSFDPAAADEAVAADPFWSPQQELVEAHGETYYSWGEDGEIQMKGRSAIRDLGMGGRLWVGDEVAVFTRRTAEMETFLAACAGDEATLADDEDFAGIAERLAGFDGAFDITFTDEVREPGDVVGADGEPIADAAADGPAPLEGVVAYGFASGRSDDPDEARIRLVLASGSDAQATANEALFADRVESGVSASTDEAWSDTLRIESTEVDGPFLIVELRADSSEVLEHELQRHDALIVSEA